MSAENDIIPTLDSSVVEVCQRVSASQAACPVSLAKEGFCNYLIIHNVRFEDAIDILKVSRRTLRHYLDTGYLDRVYGGGCRAIGVSRESLLRFMSRRTVEHRDRSGRAYIHGKCDYVLEQPLAKGWAK